MQQPDSILLAYQCNRGEVQCACALSGIERHHDCSIRGPMKMFQNRLSRIAYEQQRAYWQGYLDPTRWDKFDFLNKPVVLGGF